MLVNDLVTEDIKLPQPFMAGYLIETLPYSWKDYKNSMKHKRKQMSLEDVIIHIKIEEQNKTRDKAERAKELSSKANLVEERPRPKFNYFGIPSFLVFFFFTLYGGLLEDCWRVK